MPSANTAMTNADGSAKTNAAGAWVVTDSSGVGCGPTLPCCAGGYLCVRESAAPGAPTGFDVTLQYTHVLTVVNASGVFVTTTTASGTHTLPGVCNQFLGDFPGQIAGQNPGGQPFTGPAAVPVAWHARISGSGVGPTPVPIPNITVSCGEFFATTNNAGFAHWQIGFGTGKYAYSWKPSDPGTSGTGFIGQCGASFGGQASWDSRIAFGGGFPYSTETLSVQVVVAPVAACPSSDCSDCGDEGLSPA